MTPSTAYVLFISVSECTVVTLGQWSQIFEPSMGIRYSLSATILAGPAALVPRTMRAPCGVKKSVNEAVATESSVSAYRLQFKLSAEDVLVETMGIHS